MIYILSLLLLVVQFYNAIVSFLWLSCPLTDPLPRKNTHTQKHNNNNNNKQQHTYILVCTHFIHVHM